MALNSFRIDKISTNQAIYNLTYYLNSNLQIAQSEKYYSIHDLNPRDFTSKKINTLINQDNIQYLEKLKIFGGEINYQDLLETSLDFNIGVFNSDFDFLSIYPNHTVLIMDYQDRDNRYVIRYLGKFKYQDNNLVFDLIDTLTKNKYNFEVEKSIIDKNITINGKEYKFEKLEFNPLIKNNKRLANS